jgi:Flp pilus assembly protein TadG
MKVTIPMRTGIRRRCARRGTTAIEGALVYSVAMMLTMGIITTGLGTFRYQQIAALARLGARWASVHGPTYQKELNKPAPTSQDVMTNVVTGSMVALSLSNLTCTLTMPATTTAATGTVTASAGTTAVTSTGTATMTYPGTVTVTLSYEWVPEGWFSPVTLTSTSTLPISY